MSLLSPTLLSLALFAPHGLIHYFKSHFGDIRINGFGFKGLYRLNSFDLALLIPYFIVLFVLASYGIHRYVLVYLYYKHRRNKVEDSPTRLPNCPASRSKIGRAHV